MTVAPEDGPAAQRGGLHRRAIDTLLFAERLIFFVVGAMFFIAAFTLAVHAAAQLYELIVSPNSTMILTGEAFLDIMLLVLMLVELAYTVIATLRGSDLSAEPFLIVGLIAVIRRVLVITITTPQEAGTRHSDWLSQPLELGMLTLVVLVFVFSIVLLRRSPHSMPLSERDAF